MGSMQTHIHNCVPVENPRVSFWPRSTLDTGTEVPAYINGAFLLCGGKPHTHSVTRTHSQGNPLTYSHAPALCKCQTVGERVYLGAVWYFYTFVTASLSHTHTHTNTNWVFQHFPSNEGQNLALVRYHTVHNTRHQNTRTFMLWDVLSCLCNV